MNRKFLATLVFGLGMAASTGVAIAASSQTPAEIVSYQKAIRTKVDEHKGEYATLSTETATRIREAQDRIFRMLDGVSSLDELSAAQRTELSDALDVVKAGLVANDGSRLVCRTETRVGTNISRKRCETVASREARAREAERSMDEFNSQGRNQLESGR